MKEERYSLLFENDDAEEIIEEVIWFGKKKPKKRAQEATIV